MNGVARPQALSRASFVVNSLYNTSTTFILVFVSDGSDETLEPSM